MSSKLRLVHIDGHPLFRNGVSECLANSQEFEIVGHGATLHDAVAQAQNHLPDIMMFEINIVGNGFEAAKMVQRMHPNTKIIMLTASDRIDHVKFAIQHNILGFVTKSSEPDELIRCLRAVASGKRFITPELAARLLGGENPEQISDHAITLSHFTGRERDVVNLLAKGQTNKKIADALGLSEKTVKHHMSVVMEKLGVENRVEAALVLTRMLENATMLN